MELQSQGPFHDFQQSPFLFLPSLPAASPFLSPAFFPPPLIFLVLAPMHFRTLTLLSVPMVETTCLQSTIPPAMGRWKDIPIESCSPFLLVKRKRSQSPTLPVLEEGWRQVARALAFCMHEGRREEQELLPSSPSLPKKNLKVTQRLRWNVCTTSICYYIPQNITHLLGFTLLNGLLNRSYRSAYVVHVVRLGPPLGGALFGHVVVAVLCLAS